jgi:hypothetical protein
MMCFMEIEQFCILSREICGIMRVDLSWFSQFLGHRSLSNHYLFSERFYSIERGPAAPTILLSLLVPFLCSPDWRPFTSNNYVP